MAKKEPYQEEKKIPLTKVSETVSAWRGIEILIPRKDVVDELLQELNKSPFPKAVSPEDESDLEERVEKCEKAILKAADKIRSYSGMAAPAKKESKKRIKGMRPAILDLVKEQPETTFASIATMVAKMAAEQEVEFSQNSVRQALKGLVKDKNLAETLKDGETSFKFLSFPKKKPGRKAKAKDKL